MIRQFHPTFHQMQAADCSVLVRDLRKRRQREGRRVAVPQATVLHKPEVVEPPEIRGTTDHGQICRYGRTST